MLSEHIAIRMGTELREALARRSREMGVDVTALARAYLEEGLLMDRLPGIRFWQRGGRREAMLAGYRVSVADVVETLGNHSGNMQATAEYFGIPVWLVDQAVDCYSDRTEEIDAQLQAKAELAEREEAAWRKRQRVFAG